MQKAAQLLFDLGADYSGMFTTLEFINLHSYDMHFSVLMLYFNKYNYRRQRPMRKVVSCSINLQASKCVYWGKSRSTGLTQWTCPNVYFPTDLAKNFLHSLTSDSAIARLSPRTGPAAPKF